MHSPITDAQDAGPALLRRLPPRERQIARIVHRLGEASAAEVVAALPDPISNAAVRSMLGRLESKGVLVRYRQGRKFLYAPAVVDAPSEAALRQLSRRHFGGSMARAAAAIACLLVADAVQAR